MAKETKANIQQLLVTTGVFRASHPHVLKPSQMNDKDAPKYSIEMLFDKKNTDLKPLQLALKAAAVAKWGPDKADWPDGLAMPIRDGDKPVRNKKTKEMETKKEHLGNWVIRASTVAEYGKPYVLDRERNPIESESDFYPGCYARAALKAHAYEFGDKYGVKFILDGVQFVRDGEALGSRRSAEQMFGALEDDGDATSFSEETTDEESDELNF